MTDTGVKADFRGALHAVRERVRLFIQSDRWRNSQFALFALVCIGVVLVLNSAKVGLLLWAVGRGCLAVYMGYWADRILFRGARPHQLEGVAQHESWKRRAALVVGFLIFFALVP